AAEQQRAQVIERISELRGSVEHARGLGPERPDVVVEHAEVRAHEGRANVDGSERKSMREINAAPTGRAFCACRDLASRARLEARQLVENLRRAPARAP